MKSVEQMCRDLLELAVVEGLVDLDYAAWSDPRPQSRTAGELVGVANLLNEHLAEPRGRIKALESGLRDAARLLCDLCADGLPVTDGRHEVAMDEGDSESYPCDARGIWELLGRNG